MRRQALAFEPPGVPSSSSSPITRDPPGRARPRKCRLAGACKAAPLRPRTVPAVRRPGPRAVRRVERTPALPRWAAAGSGNSRRGLGAPHQPYSTHRMRAEAGGQTRSASPRGTDRPRPVRSVPRGRAPVVGIGRRSASAIRKMAVALARGRDPWSTARRPPARPGLSGPSPRLSPSRGPGLAAAALAPGRHPGAMPELFSGLDHLRCKKRSYRPIALRGFGACSGSPEMAALSDSGIASGLMEGAAPGPLADLRGTRPAPPISRPPWRRRQKAFRRRRRRP